MHAWCAGRLKIVASDTTQPRPSQTFQTRNDFIPNSGPDEPQIASRESTDAVAGQHRDSKRPRPHSLARIQGRPNPATGHRSPATRLAKATARRAYAMAKTQSALKSKRLSLRGVKFEDAVRAFMQTPKPKTGAATCKDHPSRSSRRKAN
jgi:hypothetical protein